MLLYLARRLFQAVVVMLVVSLIAFVLFRFVGDPVTQMLGQDATAADRARVAAALGLDQPAYIQYLRFLEQAAHGDFGRSLKLGRPVAELLAERVPATIELSLFAAGLAILVGVPLGVRTAIVRRGLVSRSLLTLSLVGISLPTFFLGVLLILVFSVTLGWLPSYGRGDTVALGWWRTGFLTVDGWRHLVLPGITLALFQLALVLRLVRAEMLEVMRTDFVKFARARGLKPAAVYFRHALRNALMPVVTIIGLQLGSIIAFALITETVFQWPGMGLLFAQSVAFADVPVMAAYLCLIALVFVTINLVVDLAYLAIDPRLRDGRLTTSVKGT
ncbi:MAG: ABC transporter permease [Alphaproteobacteria bacterium]|jgi:peptide/nickel transport system permease protein|nr:ABC transporter permease [Alphaproteobacteria bacterium]